MRPSDAGSGTGAGRPADPILALEVRLRLECPACFAHLVVELEAVRAGILSCPVCTRPATLDPRMLHRRLAALARDTSLSKPA